MLPNRCLEVGRSEMMRAKREGEHAAVMQVVLDHMPDDPLTRKFVRLAPKDIFTWAMHYPLALLTMRSIARPAHADRLVSWSVPFMFFFTPGIADKAC
jgi:hypothetical protein